MGFLMVMVVWWWFKDVEYVLSSSDSLARGNTLTQAFPALVECGARASDRCYPTLSSFKFVAHPTPTECVKRELAGDIAETLVRRSKVCSASPQP